jgi:hypothetical protein
MLITEKMFKKGFSPVKISEFPKGLQHSYKLKSQIKQHVIIPSRVSSSFLTKIRIGFLIKQEVTSSTSEGIVADNKMTWKQNHHTTFMSPKRNILKNRIFINQINQPTRKEITVTNANWRSLVPWKYCYLLLPTFQAIQCCRLGDFILTRTS